MSFTTGHEKIFLDSNILIYLLDKDELKKITVENLLQPEFFISTQVVAENINACQKKLKLSKQESFNHGHFLLTRFQVVTIEKIFFALAFDISTKYKLSFWDSLIIATALRSGCGVLYSEDMQDGFVIENQLLIKNPFKAENQK